MSIIKALQDFLAVCPVMELQPIQTDMASPSGYALAPVGGGETKRDIIGGRTYINNYVFCAKEAAQDEIDRQENYGLLEAVADWVEQQEDAGSFPALPGRYEVTGISVANGVLFEVDNDGLGLYQMQLQVEIEKGGQ